jgi:ABC-type branched-subunit amino acid transport system substrate-binding protein
MRRYLIPLGTKMKTTKMSGWVAKIPSWVLIFSFILLGLSSKAWGVEPVRIGLLIPPQQSNKSAGQPYLRGAEMAVAELNAREGKQGIQFLLVLREGHYLQKKGLDELRKIIVEDSLHFLLGVVAKEAILPVANLAQEERIPFLVFPIDFMETILTGTEPSNLFWISPAPESFQSAAVRTAAQWPKKKFFLLAQDTKNGRNWVKFFWDELRRLKPDAEPAGEILFPLKVGDYRPYLRTILGAKTEVCISHLGAKEWLRFVKTAQKQGYFEKITHFELESGTLESLKAMDKNAPEGIWGISAFPFWALGGGETKDFVTRYREKTQSYPDLQSLSGYISIYALMEAMKKGGSLNPERVLRTLPGLSFRTPIGSLSIHPTDHRALWPIWCGTSTFTSDYPFAILGNLKAFGPDSFRR